MTENFLTGEYWQQRYKSSLTGWDAGAITTPLKEYFDQLINKSVCILIPGAGNAYEAEYLHYSGFSHVAILDFATAPLENFRNRVPDFPSENLICRNFFEHEGQYDLVVEQTFFCAIEPAFRPAYAKKMHQLLKPGGKLIGLLFDDPLLERTPPPYGGSKQEYENYFRPFFKFRVFNNAYNSIPPRQGSELFMILEKPA